MRRVRVAVLVVLLAGCPKKSPQVVPPPVPDASVDAAPVVALDAAPSASGPLDRDLPRLALRAVALYEGLVAAFRAAGTNCALATTKIDELRVQNADVTAANQKVLHEGRARELKAALAKYDDKLDAAMKEIVGSQTMSKCSSDRAFTKSLDDLVGAPP